MNRGKRITGKGFLQSIGQPILHTFYRFVERPPSGTPGAEAFALLPVPGIATNPIGGPGTPVRWYPNPFQGRQIQYNQDQYIDGLQGTQAGTYTSPGAIDIEAYIADLEADNKGASEVNGVQSA